MQTHAVRRGLLVCSFSGFHRERNDTETDFDSALDCGCHLVAPSMGTVDVSRLNLAQKKEFRNGR
jgi:hypothetical protein